MKKNPFTKECIIAINNAVKLSKEKQYEFVTVDSLIVAVSETPKGKDLFDALNINTEDMKEKTLEHLDAHVPKISKTEIDTLDPFSQQKIEVTVSFEKVLEKAAILNEATKKDPEQGTDECYVIMALFELGLEDTYVLRYLSHYGVTKTDVIDYINTGKQKSTVGQKMSNKFLAKYAHLLNEKAEKGLIDPVIGRIEEIEKVITILAQRRKNNPILVGDPGVGKTAIAEGLAERIVEKKVPKQLENFKIYSLDLTAMIAGTKYRGDFEERLKGVIKEASSDPSIVLFIDEIHTLVGTGSTSGSMDASNILKPYLSNGELKVIGATTFDEHKKIFEKEGALARRFQKVDIMEPSESDSIKILMGIKSKYEDFHQVKYETEAIEAAVKLTAKYMADRRLPDKAIDVIDMVGAELKLKDEDVVITEKDVKDMVAKIARIPVSSVEGDEKTKLRNLEGEIKKEIFGQDNAVSQVVDSVILSRARLSSKDKPIGSFLLAGPSGVGKTELSKQLATKLNVPFIRFDMSEYMEKHTVARLIGAPPGYVGYEQGGQLTDAIRKNPHCVLLLDEIEKAHPDIFNILLQVMDYGTLTDNDGKKADFKNVILMMTSNVGVQAMSAKSIGFSKTSYENSEREEAIKKAFSPEFYNRLDSVIQFNPLDEANIFKVIEKQFAKLTKNLQDQNSLISFSEDVYKYVNEKGFDKKLGARPIERFVEREIAKPLAKELLFGDLGSGLDITVSIVDGKISFKYEKILDNIEALKDVEKPRKKRATKKTTETKTN